MTGLINALVVFASIWIRKKMAVATKEIEAERGSLQQGDEELGMLNPSQPAGDWH